MKDYVALFDYHVYVCLYIYIWDSPFKDSLKILRGSFRKLTWVGFEPTTTELPS